MFRVPTSVDYLKGRKENLNTLLRNALALYAKGIQRMCFGKETCGSGDPATRFHYIPGTGRRAVEAEVKTALLRDIMDRKVEVRCSPFFNFHMNISCAQHTKLLMSVGSSVFESN